MEACDEERREGCMHKRRESSSSSGESHGDALKAKIAELISAKEELKRAKDSATQSWLDSRPLIDELEKLQSGLTSAKNRASMSNIVILELQSQLQATGVAIRSVKEEELKATKMINELTHNLDRTREELEAIGMAKDEERGERSKLKQILKMRKQTLRTMQLKLRATRIESEASSESAAEALGYVKGWHTDNTTIPLSREEYFALTKRAKDEEALAEWRITVSMEQKAAAEASRNLASAILSELTSRGSAGRAAAYEEEIVEDRPATHGVEEVQEKRVAPEAEEAEENRGAVFLKARAKAIAAEPGTPNQQRKARGPKGSRNKRTVKKKKLSIFGRFRKFLIRSIKRFLT